MPAFLATLIMARWALAGSRTSSEMPGMTWPGRSRVTVGWALRFANQWVALPQPATQ